jgi:hypothetical protein
MSSRLMQVRDSEIKFGYWLGKGSSIRKKSGLSIKYPTKKGLNFSPDSDKTLKNRDRDQSGF